MFFVVAKSGFLLQQCNFYLKMFDFCRKKLRDIKNSCIFVASNLYGWQINNYIFLKLFAAKCNILQKQPYK